MISASRFRSLGRRVFAAGGAQEGFTLLEVVVSMLLLAIGLVGAAAAVSTQVNGGLSSAASTGLGAIERSKGISTATMLAQEMIEKLKENSAAVPTATTACAGTGYTAAGGVCTETAVSGFSNYSRTTTVATDPSLPGGSATSTTATVVVTYKAFGAAGTSLGGQVTLATIIAERP